MAKIETTEERIKRVFVEHLGVEIERLTNDAKVMDELGADSLDNVELVMALEEEFQIEITDEEAEGTVTDDKFSTWIALVETKIRIPASA